MSLKFGDKVKVRDTGFYKDSTGVIINYDKLDNKYEVLLGYNQIKNFKRESLQRIKNNGKVKKLKNRSN